MKPSPAFQFYPSDFLVGTADMTADEVGGYIRLLCYQWTKGKLPNNDRKLMQLSGVFTQQELETIKSKFHSQDDGTIVNLRMESVRSDQDEYRRKQSEKAKSKWESKRDAAALPMDMLETCPSSSSSSSKKEIKREKASPDGGLFDRFWSMYAKSADKDKCKRKFSQLSQKDIDSIFATLPNYIARTQDKKFRKNPLTYLNGKCWLDEEDVQVSDNPKWYESIITAPTGTVERAKQIVKAFKDVPTSEIPYEFLEPFKAYLHNPIVNLVNQ